MTKIADFKNLGETGAIPINKDNLNAIKNEVDILGLGEFLYDSTETYAVGDQVLMNKKIYECTEVTDTVFKWKELGPIFVPDDFEPSTTVVSTPKPTN